MADFYNFIKKNQFQMLLMVENKMVYRMSEWCLMPTQQFVSYIMARTSYILMGWWWCLLCSRSTLRVI